ncbi:Streptavidin-V2 [Geodia barretti]|uniref:Streptavidin-V2 n=1 Tax=Geodia barretti TaxID=519541 RepID=A0AA35SM14_GEOBA|nr:Streptavidin-V2 [Geodia barretti]
MALTIKKLVCSKLFQGARLCGRAGSTKGFLVLRSHHGKAEGCELQIAEGQTWHNELGSKMVVTSADPATGVFGGIYNSKVGDAEKWYVLTGRQDIDGDTVGWTVNWNNAYNNAHSVTTWSGQQQLRCSDPVILTTWLLTRQTSPENDWESTQIGSDQFFLDDPSPEAKEKAKFHCRNSHPKDA